MKRVLVMLAFLICAIVLIVMQDHQGVELERKAELIWQEIEAKYEKLSAGESGVISVEHAPADILLYLPCYTTESQLVALVENQVLAEYLAKIVSNDRYDFLVWIKDNRILAKKSISSKIGISATAKAWLCKHDFQIFFSRIYQQGNSSDDLIFK
jgi:hypothetical protein